MVCSPDSADPIKCTPEVVCSWGFQLGRSVKTARLLSIRSREAIARFERAKADGNPAQLAEARTTLEGRHAEVRRFVAAKKARKSETTGGIAGPGFRGASSSRRNTRSVWLTSGEALDIEIDGDVTGARSVGVDGVSVEAKAPGTGQQQHREGFLRAFEERLIQRLGGAPSPADNCPEVRNSVGRRSGNEPEVKLLSRTGCKDARGRYRSRGAERGRVILRLAKR
jgi:hypothetical protein